MRKKTKITLIIVAVVVLLLVAVFFLAPLNDWKKDEEDRNERMQNMQTLIKWKEPRRNSYFSYCLGWWSMKLVKKQEPETPIDDVQEEKKSINPELLGIIQNAIKDIVIYTVV